MTVPSLDADEALLGNANFLGVYMAPVGTAAVTDIEIDTAPWATLGWVSEDGVSINPERSIDQLRAWQSPTAIKNVLTEYNITVDMELLQHNPTTLSHYWGQTEPTEVSGTVEMDVDVLSDNAPQGALIVDTRDGDQIARYVFHKVQVTSVGELSVARGGFQALPVTFTALDPGTGIPATVYLLTDAG